MILLDILRVFVVIIAALLAGKLVAKFKLPAVLGWLISGMLLGPHALGLLGQSIIDARWYQIILHILETTVGLMIGSELVWKKMKQMGKQIFIITFVQSIGTFLVVSLLFGLVFIVTDIPLYLAFVFGGIALATAPAPALSIVREYKTNGPVTQTLIPLAALDDVIGVAVFLSVIAFVSNIVSTNSMPSYMIAVIIFLPLVIGAVVGFLSYRILEKNLSVLHTNLILLGFIILSSMITMFFNEVVLPTPALNFMLVGMAFSATFSNKISEERLEHIMKNFNPILLFAFIVMIFNLGAPLDYHLILGAGLYTALYIIARAIGKMGGAYVGAKITNAPNTVQKYLGFTLLPHSGVSLVFTGIASSMLVGPDPQSAAILQGTIAAAAVINEIIAVILSKQALKKSGEFYALENK